jgi:hypothetical protein
MLARFWRRPSHATVVAYLALIVALGGSAYAATSLPAGSVGAAQIKAGAVTANKLAKNAVTAKSVADHSLTDQQIDVSRLGSVPDAAHATSADRAGTATNAGHASTADHAATADQATAAASATDAGHASNADHATIAAHAGDSDLLGGAPPASYLVGCPSAMIAATGLCIEANTRADADWQDAMSTCAGANRRLPSPGELALAFNNLGATQAAQWTSDFSFDGSIFRAAVISQTVSRALVYSAPPITGTSAYRCVSTPTSGAS